MGDLSMKGRCLGRAVSKVLFVVLVALGMGASLAQGAAPETFTSTNYPQLFGYKVFGDTSVKFINAAEIKERTGSFGTNGNLYVENASLTVPGNSYIKGNVTTTTGDVSFGTVSMHGDFLRIGGTTTADNARKFYSYNITCADKASLTISLPGGMDDCDQVPAFPVPAVSVPLLDEWTSKDDDITLLDSGIASINGIPSGTDKFKDFYIDKMNLGVAAKLHIRQKRGSLTRIFVKTMDIRNLAEIVVDYPTTGGGYAEIPDSLYQGSVLIYSLNPFEAGVGVHIQGTLASSKLIKLRQEVKAAGQILAGRLEFDHGFSGGDFKYVPFDPPLVKIDTAKVNSVGGNFVEDGKDGVAQIIPVVLSSKSVVKAQMSYKVLAYTGTDKAVASPADFVEKEGLGKTGVLEIAEGADIAGNVSLKLIDDSDVERSPEYFTLKLCAVEGVALPDPDTSGCQYFDLTIAPSDTNHAPEFAADTISLSLAENQKANTVIHTFMAFDTLDKYTDKPELTYKLIKPDSIKEEKFPFELSSAGELKSTKSIDFEDKASYYDTCTFWVEVNDNSTVFNHSLKDSVLIKLTLTDANDAPTAMTLSPNSVVENAKAKTFVGILTATDQDAIVFPDRKATETFVYSLPQAADQSVFQISNDTLYTKSSLDFETKASYDIQVMVADSKNASLTQTFSVVVRDTNDAPTAISLSKDSVSENQDIGTLVGTLGAADQDTMFNRLNNDSFTYSLVSGTGDTDNASFQITGVQLQTLAMFDYETKASYSIRVRVTDKGGLTKESVFVIKVHDENEAPYFGQDTLRVSVPENTSAVDTIQATDIWNAPLTYSLSTGADASLFSVNPTSGSLVFSSAPNFENPLDANKDNAYELRVRASNGVFSAEQVVIVTVTDVQEIGTLPATATKSQAENTTAVLQVSVEDVDAKQSKVYTLSGGADASLFTIDETGALSFVSAPDFESPLDQGKDNIYVVVVSVSDNEEPEFSALQQTVTVTVTNVDENPLAIAHDYTTPEEIAFTVPAPGILVGATDPEGAVLKDSLVLPASHGILDLAFDGSFSYTPAKDYFGRDTFTYVVIDPAGHASEPRTVAVTVTPVNDPPELAPVVYTLDENAPVGTVVGQLLGTDVDGDRLTYVLVSGSGFVVATNGQITVDTGMVLDYESAVKSFLIRVSASDNSGASDTADVGIVLKNVVETANVMVVSAQAGDSLWSYPDTVWVNKNTVDVSWAVEGSLRKDTDSVKTNAFTQLVKTASVPEKDLPGSDTLVVVMNDKAPIIDILLPPKRPNPIPGTTAVEPSDTTDPVIYINDKERDIAVSIQTKDKQMQDALVLDTIRPVLKEGLNDVTYTYTDIYGNTATKTVQVYLDLTAPVVVIQSPENLYKTSNVLQYVVWTVDGDTMDVLNLQSLQDGANTIVRAYRDKAGNEASDTVIVFFEMGKGIELSMEKDLVTLDPETIEKYYAANPPKEDELYSVSLLNLETGKEEKVSYGKGAATHAGDSSEPYAGLSGTHLGPTLVVRIRLPQMGGTDATGAARGGQISDLVENGMVALTSGTGSERTMVPVSDYVSGHCLADAFDKGLSLEEMLASPQYKSTVSLKVHVFDVTGQFVDNMSVTQEIESASYLDDAGVLTLFFELKPSREHGLEDITGRQYGTGAYLMNASVKAVSVRRCDTPDGAKGEKIKSSDQVLEKFGYMRASW